MNVEEIGLQTQGMLTRSGPTGANSVRYAVITELVAAGSSIFLTGLHPAQVLTNLFGFHVTGIDDAGCPCGQWWRMQGAGWVTVQSPPVNCP